MHSARKQNYRRIQLLPGLSAKPDTAVLVKVGVHVRRSVLDAFRVAARAQGWTVAKALRTVMEEAAGQASDGSESDDAPPGSARKLNLRLRDEPRAALLRQAEGQRTSPAAWATALLEAALLGTNRPVWGKREAEELRALYMDLKRIEGTTSDPAALDAIRRAMLRVADNVGRLERTLR